MVQGIEPNMGWNFEESPPGSDVAEEEEEAPAAQAHAQAPTPAVAQAQAPAPAPQQRPAAGGDGAEEMPAARERAPTRGEAAAPQQERAGEAVAAGSGRAF